MSEILTARPSTYRGDLRNVIVFDTSNKPFLENNIFKSEVACRYPGGMFWAKLFEEGRKRGFDVVTCDQVDLRGIRPRDCILVTEQWSPQTTSLILRGALPAVVMSIETLWYAWPFYSNLERISSVFRHVFVFRGAHKWVSGRSTVLHTMYFPQPHRSVIDPSKVAWKDKQFMVLVNTAIRVPAGASYRRACKKEPAIANDLYGARLRGMLYFAGMEGFHLYGRGWDQPHPWMSDGLNEAVSKCYLGECTYENKVTILSNYRFALCFENTRFKGYITEKIFDCFFAGCIPVYCGPSDIDSFVPKEAYISFDDFESYDELDAFLRGLKEEQAARYLRAAAEYLASCRFAPFDQNNVAKEFIDVMESCAAENRTERRLGGTVDLLILEAKFAYRAAKVRLAIMAHRLKRIVGR